MHHTTRHKPRAIAIARTAGADRQYKMRLFVIASGAICALSFLAIAALT